MNWILKLFTKEKTENTPPMKKFLIVGLGNIGAEYVNTRHNIGFKILDHFAKKEGVTFQTAKLGDLAEYKVKGRTLLLLKPNTYMNLSGKAVKYWMEKEKIEKENVLIITDDLNIAFGTIRIKTKGSDGGHNGLKDIDLSLGGNDYARLRIGIGSEFRKGQQVDFVLGKWDKAELKDLPFILESSADAVLSYASVGPKFTMEKFNKKVI